MVALQQARGLENAPKLFFRLLQAAVAHHIIERQRLLDFIDRLAQTAGNDFLTVGLALAQALFQHGQAGRQDENA